MIFGRERVVGECYECKIRITNKQEYYKCKSCGRLLHPFCTDKYRPSDWWWGYYCHCGGRIKKDY